MSAEIDEYPSLRFKDIRKKNKVSRTDTRTDGHENSIPHHKVYGGYNNCFKEFSHTWTLYWMFIQTTGVSICGLVMWIHFLKFCYKYRKFPKYSDTQKNCCNHSKNWAMLLFHRVMSPNNADRMANSVDPDQTTPLGATRSSLICTRSSLIRVYTVCPGISVRKLRIIMVI